MFRLWLIWLNMDASSWHAGVPFPVELALSLLEEGVGAAVIRSLMSSH